MLEPKDIIETLIEDHKMSEADIVDALKAFGVETTQPTINRIKHGVHKTFSFDVGRALERLHEERASA